MTVSDKKVEPTTEFHKSMLLLENDLDALGWDQPPRIYALMGEEDDWTMELVTEMGGHPVDFMRMMVATGRFDDSVMGVAIATEGWRHPTWDETKVSSPEKYETIMAKAAELGISEEEAEERAKEVYNDAMTQFRPSENERRIEIRNVMVYMRDGRSMGVHRDRGSDAELLTGVGEGRVVEAMKATLTGEWPKGLTGWYAEGQEEEDPRESDEARMLMDAIQSVKNAINKRKGDAQA